MLAKFSVKKPLTVIMAVIVVLVLGFVSFTSMTPDLLPNIDFPYVVIVTTYPGASPEKIETTVTKPIEQSMATLENFKSVQSTSNDSYSMVVLQFNEDANMDSVTVDIRESLDAVESGWDDTIQSPFIMKLNPNMLPVAVSAVNMEGMDVTELSAFVNDTLKQKLEGTDGVADITVSGAVEENLNVFLTEEKINAVNTKLRAAISKSFEDGEKQIASGRSQLNSAKNELSTQLNSLNEQAAALTQSKQMLNSLKTTVAQLNENRATLSETVNSLSTLKNGIDQSAAALAVLTPGTPEYMTAAATLAQLNAALEQSGMTYEQLDVNLAAAQSGLAQIDDGLAQINAQLASFGITADNIDSKLAEIDAGEKQMTAALPQLQSGIDSINSSLAELESSADQLAEKKKETVEGTDISDKINMDTVSSILTAQNFSMPAGYVTDGEGTKYLVRLGDEFASAEEMKDLVLFDLGLDGVEPVKLSDIADVAVTDNAAEIYAKINGEDGVVLSFTKQSTAATSTVSENISKKCKALSETYPGLTFTNLMDQGDYIKIVVNSVIDNLLWGALLAIIILLLFLKDIKPTFMIAMSIPLSVVFAIVLMYFSGVTLNMISLSGLAVGVGMLVDNSVVVIENIYRLRAKGVSAKKAAVAGASQVAGAITSSTLTTICVFAPIVFIEGITRQLFTDMALTIAYSLLASLIVALTFVPSVASGMLVKYKDKPHKAFDKFLNIYEKALRFVLNRKALAIIVVIVVLVASVFFTLRRGFEFMPDMEAEQVTVTLQMPQGSTFEETTAMSDKAVSLIENIDGVETVGAMMGGSSMMSMGSTDTTTVSMYVLMDKNAKVSSESIAKSIDEACAGLDCDITASGASEMSSMMSGMGGSGVSLKVYGDNLDELRDTAQTVGSILETVDGVDTVDNGLEDATSELKITVDKEKAALNSLTAAQIYMQVSAAMTTEKTSTTLSTAAGGYSVLVNSVEDGNVDDNTIRSLKLSVTGMDGTTKEVPLTDVADISESTALNSISRDSQRRYITVSATVAEGNNVSLVASAAKNAVSSYTAPEGVTLEFSGENETIMDSMGQLVKMLLLAILLVYVIMVAQFQSLKSPFIVMFTIPLAFTGGLLGLLVTGKVISIISMIGFVMLAGIIVNNGIVLVDYINRLRADGIDKRAALIEAGRTRMRPILMTSLTTILALSVMAVGVGTGSALMQPVAIVCIGGMIYATVMTLFIVPVLYDLFNRKELRVVKDEDVDYTENADSAE